MALYNQVLRGGLSSCRFSICRFFLSYAEVLCYPPVTWKEVIRPVDAKHGFLKHSLVPDSAVHPAARPGPAHPMVDAGVSPLLLVSSNYKICLFLFFFHPANQRRSRFYLFYFILSCWYLLFFYSWVPRHVASAYGNATRRQTEHVPSILRSTDVPVPPDQNALDAARFQLVSDKSKYFCSRAQGYPTVPNGV